MNRPPRRPGSQLTASGNAPVSRDLAVPRQPLVATALMTLLLATGTEAVQLKHFAVDTPQELAAATSRGIAVFPDGSLVPLPALESVAAFDEPLGLALAVTADNVAYVGTGHPARLWRVASSGRELLAELPVDQITDLLLDPRGDLYVSTAVPAALYRLTSGAREVREVARLAEGNLWDLAWYRGRLLAAAGNPARLMRLDGDTLTVLAKIPDRHVRCLEISGESLLVGTSGKGLVLRMAGEGPLGVVYDSEFTEIAALASAPDGTIWAAGLTGDPTMGKPPAKTDGEPTVTIQEGAPATPTTEKGPATSEIIRILPNGAATTAHRFTKQIAGTVAWGSEGPVIGTGLEGELWQLVAGSAVMLDTVEASQVTRLGPGGSWVLTQGPVRLLRRAGPLKGSLTSPALDAGSPAQWGEVDIQGRLPAEATCALHFRSGAVAEPDDTWSDWSSPVPCLRGRASAPPSRFLQWRVELASSGQPAPRVGRVRVAYQQLNVPPVIKDLKVYDPGEVYLKTPPPADKVIEVHHPDLSGIFTTLEDNTEESQGTGRKYYRVGYQSLSWKAEDTNGDPLVFDVAIQPFGATSWWPLRERLETVVLAFDTQALADGVYRFRLTASDLPANPQKAETATVVSSSFVVDNTPPALTVTRGGSGWEILVQDALSPISRVEWNRDALRWEALEPTDGLLDGREERFRLPVQPGNHLLTIRAVDDHHNRAATAVEEGE